MKILDVNDYLFLKQLDYFLLGHDGFIAGGCFKNLFLKEPVKDIDIFFYNSRGQSKAIDRYNTLVKEKKAILLYDNDRTTCFYDIEKKTKVDLVKTVYGSPQQIIDQFDFTITKAFYQKISEAVEQDEFEHVYNIQVHDDFFEHLIAKRLVIDDKILFAGSTFERILRYGKKGYSPCRGTKIKMLEAIHDEVDSVIKRGGDISKLLTASLYTGVD